MRVLIACEFSGIVRDAFIRKGHDAVSCDLLPSESIRGPHIQGDVLDILGDGWDLMIAHPPCTYLTVTANKWFKDQPPRKSGALVGAARRAARDDAVEFFLQLANCGIPQVCLENPVGVMSSRWRKPDQIIQPMMFGHPAPKKTCLWLKGLQELKPTQIVEPEYKVSNSGKRLAKWYYWAGCAGTERKLLRERTFTGVAEAMADQWGGGL